MLFFLVGLVFMIANVLLFRRFLDHATRSVVSWTACYDVSRREEGAFQKEVLEKAKIMIRYQFWTQRPSLIVKR